jgi:hypothetical protein
MHRQRILIWLIGIGLGRAMYYSSLTTGKVLFWIGFILCSTLIIISRLLRFTSLNTRLSNGVVLAGYTALLALAVLIVWQLLNNYL